MPKNNESVGEQSGIPWGESGGTSGYKPAFPLGNERDARIMAESSGRPVEEFLAPHISAALETLSDNQDEADDKKEE